eukprot:gnl/MRDRNA2_/MRDRNA2_88777_c0_seq1.p1 gnl/MRDRNA2_/MRDRNA2_88777_c0~~gnl/MRDRNA2_/MRDRNA2_88777_c0_seq1.p1  ORF type:complete len:480 (-),score=115.38 gnl/MRDRNA2_/MRDRNA2_88777_c0_seq1:82-1521(-)
MPQVVVSVNAVSVALLALTSVVTATHGPIAATPEFAVGGAHHPTQKGFHHHLRHPPQFNAEKPDDKWDITHKEPEHHDAAHDDHGGTPGAGGEPMVPRTHEHGDVEAEHNYGWSYEFPEHWEKSYKFCGGSKQSPINLPSKLRKARDAGDGNLSTIASYSALSDLHIDNNGHNIQVNGKFGNITLPSGVYEAAQFNFHFPSEHKVDGAHAAGEIQVVHQKLGADGTQSLVILAILLEEVIDEWKEEAGEPDPRCHVCNELMFLKGLGFPAAKMCNIASAVASEDKLTSEEELKEEVEEEELQKKEEEAEEKEAEAKEEKQADALVQFRGDPPSAPAPGAPGAAPAVPFAPAPAPVPVLPKEGRSLSLDGEIDIGSSFSWEMGGGYYHYHGSLTTPPCSETVEWFVLDRKAAVTTEMVDAFKKLFPDPANARPVQRLNGREIVWSQETVPEEAPPARSATKAVEAGLGLVSLIYCVVANA